MVFFGINLTPMGWLMAIVGAALALVIPFGIIGTLAEPLPDPFDIFAEVAFAYVGFPMLLCILHSRKVFGRGIGSAFFRIYTWFYLLLGLVTMIGAAFADGFFSVSEFTAGILMTLVGVAMIWWTWRTGAAFQSAIEDDQTAQEDMER